MSELEQKDSEQVSNETPEEAEASSPRTLKIHGKEFDVSTPEGLLHAQAWGEAVSSLVGRQGQELGSLRQFAKANAPTKDEQELLKEAKRLAGDGDTDSAFDLMFRYTKEVSNENARKLAMERQNAEAWDNYFETRPELTKVFGKKVIRKVSEAEFDLANYEGDAFAMLDQFWMTKIPTPAEKPSKIEKPPVTLSGGATRRSKEAPKEEPKKVPTIEELLDARSDRRR